MKIVSGMARGIEILTAPGFEVRPTLVRARCALMDSLRDFGGLKTADLCAGSGAIGLEAASRGAAAVLFVDTKRRHCRAIEDNIARIRKAGAVFDAEIICADILDCCIYSRHMNEPDLIFADPPYAESAGLWKSLCALPEFQQWSRHAKIVWELPDTPGAAGLFMSCPLAGREGRVRRLGSASFFIVD